MSTQPAPIEVFYSYADADESLRIELEKHLSQLRRDGLITVWHKRQIVAGMDWAKALDRHLNIASVVLLLISANFVASDYCYGTEMQLAMERHEAGEAHVVPILLRPVDWQSAPFGKLQALPSNGKPITQWRNRNAAFADVAQGIRVVLQEVQRLAVSTPRTSFPRIWNIPYPRNPMFTGREEILTHLVGALKVGQATALSQPLALSGLGGVGKTQVAVEYAYQHYQDYQVVFWTPADTRESLVSGYITIARLLNLPEKGEQDQTIIIEAVLHWLTAHTEWLLILDNADDLTVVHEFVPPVFGGCILLTTRVQAMGRLAARIEVDTMPTDIGALFLLRRALLIPSDASLQDADKTDVAKAREICKELGGFPLALDQAGAFIEEVQCSLQDYQQRYQEHRTHLLERRGGVVSDHPAPVATTWSLSFEKVEQHSPVAADLLRLCAFLYPDAIPVELVTKGASHLGSLLAKVSEDDLTLDDAVAALSAYSLIRRNPSDQTLSIHRLVQAVLKDTMNEEAQKLWTERAVHAVHAVFPAVKFETWSQCERYLPHALVCAELVEQEQFRSLEAADLLNKAGWYLDDRARYVEAEPLYRQALSIREQQLGMDHADIAHSLNNLAELYRKQGRYEQTERLYKRALAINEQVYGPEHSEVATNLNNLALFYWEQGEYEMAEPLYQRALSILEQKLGETHPDTATCLNNLASLYNKQGKYEMAEPLYQRALSVDEKVYGLEHPDVARDLHNLATLYDSLGKYETAEPLFKRALRIWEQTLGETHPNTQKARRRYVSLLRKMERNGEATALETQGQLPSEEH